MDALDFAKHRQVSAQAAAATLLHETMERVADGDLQTLGGMVVIWVTADGLVNYGASDNIGEDSVLAMVGPVQLAASWRLYEETLGGEENA